jgi:hypothetical protein
VSKSRTYLKVPKLGEWLAAVIESADVWLGLIVDDLMGADIAPLSEFLSTDVARKWSLTSMASLVSLQSS